MAQAEPARYLDAFLVDLSRSAIQVRPAAMAAVEVGAGNLWSLMEQAMQVEMSDLLDLIGRVHNIDRANLPFVARALRRTVMGAMFDPEISAQELCAQLDALMAGSNRGRSRPDR